jgi:hypothetical protein
MTKYFELNVLRLALTPRTQDIVAAGQSKRPP